MPKRNLQVGDSASFSKVISQADMSAYGCCTGHYLAVLGGQGRMSVTKTITDDDIAMYGLATGDRNRVHFDDEFAARTRFKGRIAHGMLSAGMFANPVAIGDGKILVHHFDFVRPVRPNTEITATASVTGSENGRTTLKTECLNDQGKPVITGYAEVEWLPGFDHFDACTEATAHGNARHRNGILAAGLISTVLGTQLPGDGTIYLTQHLEFHRDVEADDEITATATITEIGEDGVIKLDTTCVNQRGETVLTGYARVMYDPPQE